MRNNTSGLKKDIYKPLEDKLRRKLAVLPDIAVKFLHSTKKKIRTQIEYSKDLTLFFDFLLLSKKVNKSTIQDINVEDIKSVEVDDLEEFFDYLLDYEHTYISSTGKVIVQHFENSPAGISRKRATLQRFFGFLVKRDYMEKDVTKKLEKDDIPDSRDIKDRLRPEEVQKFFEVILDNEGIGTDRLMKFHLKLKHRDYIMTLLLAYTGIRVGELVQLDIDDIYLKREYFEILRKGGKKEHVTMPLQIIDDISDFVEERKKMKDIESNALFLSLRKKRVSDKTVREMLKKYQERSGIDIHVTPHLFRRTFGTKHYNDYQDMYLTAKVLGHSSAETTRKHYADPSKEREVKSMQQFGYGNEIASQKSDEAMQRVAEKYGIPLNILQQELK